MQTLVPIGTFEEKARKQLGKAGFDEMLELLAKRPKAGRTAEGTLCAARKGKSGGAGVIYYYNDTKPILLLLIYA